VQGKIVVTVIMCSGGSRYDRAFGEESGPSGSSDAKPKFRPTDPSGTR
jgi:hypothetical protein